MSYSLSFNKTYRGRESGSQGHSLLLVSDPEGLRQKAVPELGRNWLMKINSSEWKNIYLSMDVFYFFHQVVTLSKLYFPVVVEPLDWLDFWLRPRRSPTSLNRSIYLCLYISLWERIPQFSL